MCLAHSTNDHSTLRKVGTSAAEPPRDKAFTLSLSPGEATDEGQGPAMMPGSAPAGDSEVENQPSMPSAPTHRPKGT